MKFRLLTPGPTPVPEETLLEMAKPVFFHRSAEFRQILGEVLKDLQQVFLTKNPILPLTSSGTGALEAALVNAVPQGKKIICLIAGRFGERWKSIAKAYGIEAVSVTVPYGQVVQPEQLQKALADHPDAVAVCTTLSETSTGIGHDIAAFGKIVAPTPQILIVDAVSGLGAMECRTDAWNIDICCTGSQKALMMPPGLAFLSVNDKGWKAIDANANQWVPAYGVVTAGVIDVLKKVVNPPVYNALALFGTGVSLVGQNTNVEFTFKNYVVPSATNLLIVKGTLIYQGQLQTVLPVQIASFNAGSITMRIAGANVDVIAAAALMQLQIEVTRYFF